MEQPKSNENIQSVADTLDRLHNLASEHPDPEKDKIANRLTDEMLEAKEAENWDKVDKLMEELVGLYENGTTEMAKAKESNAEIAERLKKEMKTAVEKEDWKTASILGEKLRELDENKTTEIAETEEPELNPGEPHESQTEKQEELEQTAATSADELSAFLKEHFRPIDEAENKRRREEEERQKRERESQKEKERREDEESHRNYQAWEEREKVLRGLMKQIEKTLNCDEIKTHEIDKDLVLKCVKTIIEPHGFKLMLSRESDFFSLYGIVFWARGKKEDLYCETDYGDRASNAEADGVTVRYTFSFKLQRGKRNSSDLKTVEYKMRVEPRYSWDNFGDRTKNY
jgi:hypothetical protein